jgi:hypothetical protein
MPSHSIQDMAADIKDILTKLLNSKYFAVQYYEATNIADYYTS